MDSRTRAVNIKYEPCDTYGGRGHPLGNPFIVGKDGSRQTVIDSYRKYFFEKISGDIRFRDYVHRQRGKRLGCSCKPRDCHLDVVVEYLNGL
jgi:hypothetical protein